MALSVVLVLAVTILTLPYPLIIKSMLDDALPNKDMDLLFLLMALFLGTFLLRGALGYLYRYVLQRMGMRITCDLRKDLFAHLQTLSVKYYDKRHTGAIASRISDDTGSLFGLITGVIVTFLSDAVTVIGVAIVLFCMSWKLALIALAVMPLFLLNYRMSKGKLRKLSRRHRRNWDRVVGFLHERVASSRLIKSFSAEEREIARFNKGIEADFRNFNHLSLYNTRLAIVAEIVSSLGMLLVLGIGGLYVIQGYLSVGELVAFNAYLGYLFGPIVRLNDMNAVVQRAVTALEKVHELLDTPSFVSEKKDAVRISSVKGTVEFRDVSFSYDAGQKILNRINLTVDPGQMVAIVGPSGSGKTTLVNLLCRFYDPDSGVILLDGHDLRDVTIQSLRSQIGVVMQDNLLFSGALMENIRYGRPEANMAEVIDAAKAANAHDFITRMPRGYSTTTGERGVSLSGGQKQRIAIARAILKQPRILVFDEATSALDTESERLIQNAMERLMRNRTTFVIAHRLSTVVKADKIVVMQNGQIAEEGTHAQLLELNGVYAHLHALQFRSTI